jgi:hypothetical protein
MATVADPVDYHRIVRRKVYDYKRYYNIGASKRKFDLWSGSHEALHPSFKKAVPKIYP